MSNNGISRRQFLQWGAMTAGVVALAACAPAPGAPAPAGEAATGAEAAPPEPTADPNAAQYWVAWSNLAPSWNLIVETPEWKEWMGSDKVELRSGPDATALLTAVAAGSPPDGASNYQYLDYMARGVLLPVTDLVAASSIVKQEDYLEGTWNDGFFEGVQYGVPANEGFLRYGLNYNAQMVEEAGLDPDTPPQTWEECLEWHKALTKFDSAGNLQQIGLDPYDAMGGQLAIQDGFFPAVSWGWTWYDPATKTFDFDNESMIQSFDVMGEFIKIAGPDNMAGMRQNPDTGGGWGGSYNAGIQAMIIEGYWHPGETAVQKPEVSANNRATWAPVPGSRAGTKVQGTGGHYVMLFKEGAHTDIMFKAAEFLNTDTAMNIIFKNTGWLPGRPGFIGSIDPAVFPGLDFYFNSLNEATEWSSPARCPITQFANQQYTQLRDANFRGEISSAEAAAEMQKRCTDELKNQGLA